MKKMFYIPEILVLLLSFAYLVLYILNDTAIYQSPSWFLSLPIPYITLALIVFLLFYRDGEQKKEKQ